MDQITAHQRAQDVFHEVLANVKPDQLGAPSPCSEWDAQGVIDHVVGGNQWVQGLAGRQPADLPEDLIAAHAASAAGAHDVFAAPDGLTRMFELPFGTLPGTAFGTKEVLGKRELDVARLVADGLTNKEIGTRLFISERTVDSHVRSILNKLGFGHRAQIAAWLASPDQ